MSFRSFGIGRRKKRAELPKPTTNNVISFSGFVNMDSPLLDQQSRINAVRVEGAKNTRRSFLASIVYPHLPQHPHSSFESVLHATRDIGHYLVQSDIFQTVHARLEPSADATTKPGDVDIIFATRERPQFFLKTSTEVGNSEGNAVRIHSIPRMPYPSQEPSLFPRARQVE